MKTFKDTTGRDWTLALSIDVAKRVRDLSGRDLMTIISGGEAAKKLFEDLSLDLYTIGDVLWAMVKPEADAAGISATQFAELMADGSILSAAVGAMLEEITSFFDNFRRTTVITKSLQKSRAAAALMFSRMETKMDQETVEQLVDRIETENTPPSKSGASSMTPPAASASTPAD